MIEMKETWYCKDCEHHFSISFESYETPFCPCCGADYDETVVYVEEEGEK